jgi:hypothetical protein
LRLGGFDSKLWSCSLTRLWTDACLPETEHCIAVTSQQFNLVTQWRVKSPLKPVWDEIVRPDDWPQWWRAIKRVEMLREGDADGVGAERRLTWRTALPYDVTFEMRSIRIEPMSVIEGRATGELQGLGRWTFDVDGPTTLVRYDWRVDVTKPWMRTFAPVLRPAFVWNHGVVMGWGYEGLCRRLGVAP